VFVIIFIALQFVCNIGNGKNEEINGTRMPVLTPLPPNPYIGVHGMFIVLCWC
jgi:hypothetical protein